MHDVIVCGAGPAGSYLSHLLSSRGYDVLNLEEHGEIGRPVECTGVVTSRVFSYVKSDSIANRVRGAHVYFPGGGEISIGKSEETIVIYRDSFDRDVSAMAIASGADVRLNARVSSVSVSDEGATVRFRSNGNIVEERARIVVGADGANSIVRKDLYGIRPARVVSTYQVDYAVRLEDQDSVSVYLGDATSRGFFAWAVPTGDITRLGLGTMGNGARNLFANLEKRFPANRTLGITGGPIPIAYVPRSYGNRSLLVGDAAGIVKPLTGGGIYTGIVSSYHAARAISEALDQENCSRSFLSRYQKYWKAHLGRELWMDGIIQRIFAGLGDRALDGIYRMISSQRTISLINSLGDIDYPSRLIMTMIIRNPWILANFFRRSPGIS